MRLEARRGEGAFAPWAGIAVNILQTFVKAPMIMLLLYEGSYVKLSMNHKQAQLGVPHSRKQVELGFILQAGTWQILNFA